MLHSPSAATWLPTYDWCAQLTDTMTGTDGTSDVATARILLLSQVTWHKRKAAAWFMQPAWTVKSPSYTCRLQALAQPSNHSCPDLPKDDPELSATRRQWEEMREYYLSTNLWPSTERHNPTMLEGGSPLVWTMLYPPATVARCLTYSWTGHLDNFLPWANDQSKRVTRPPLISYARWNIRRSQDSSPLPPDEANNPLGPFYRSHASVAKATPQHTQELQQPETSHMFVTPIGNPMSPRGISPRQMTQKHHVSAIASTSEPHCSSLIRNNMAAAMGYCLQSNNPDFEAPPLRQFLEGDRHWNYHRPSRQAQPVKSQKSCSRWTTAIIQRLWDTAWDLVTHRNVEILPSRVWPAHQQTVGDYPLFKCTMLTCIQGLHIHCHMTAPSVWNSYTLSQ